MSNPLSKSLTIFAVILSLHSTIEAQNKNATTTIEALKNLVPLNPFKVRQEQAQNFDPSKGGVYFEDGSKLSIEKFLTYLKDTNYVAVPYATPENGNIQAMLVRKSTGEEKEFLKNMFSTKTSAFKQPMQANPEITPENASEYEAIQFDPNLKAADVIKNLKKQEKITNGASSVNVGRVPVFNVEGKLVPVASADGPSKEYMALIRNKDLTSDYFVDDKGEVKAIVYRKATLEERNSNATMTVATGSGGSGSGSSSTSSTTGVASVASGFGRNQEERGAVGQSETEDDLQSNLLGKKAPPFEVTDINGNKVSLSDLAKQKMVVVLNFWFTQCAPCNMEIPELNKLVAEFKNKSVVFVALATNDKETLTEFFKTNKFDYKQVADCIQLSNRYGVFGFPTNIVLDKESKVVLCESGYNTEVPNKIRTAINNNL